MNARYPAHEPNASPLNEADTCRKYVVQKLQASGREHDSHATAEQHQG